MRHRLYGGVRGRCCNAPLYSIGKNLSYQEILKELGGKDRVNILCKTINNQQYLEQVHYFLDKNLKEISKKYDQTNCNKNAEINIKRNNEYAS